MRLNTLKLNHLATPRTHEGAPASILTAEQALRRSVLSCMLWEDEFYEDGVEIQGRIRELVPRVKAAKVAELAVEARERMKLRHAPLLLVREMARHLTHRALVSETLTRVIQRADELAEFVAIYWAGGKQPLSAQVKKGLAAAFSKFDEYALAKYDRAGRVRLRDVLFLSHARPNDEAQAALWKRLVQNELTTPDTWEVALSALGRNSAGKREAWERLLGGRKLGALALLRNLRNLREADVNEELVVSAITAMKTDRVLPFRFLAAARHAPQWECALEQAMFRGLADRNARLAGHTVLLVDVSGSMESPIARQSEMRRADAACGLAILLREIAERVTIYTFSETARLVPARRGMALRDAIEKSQPHAGTYLGLALRHVEEDCRAGYDRLVVITDEQSHDQVRAPLGCSQQLGRSQRRGCGYVINVASNRNGVGYGEWTHIDGWSEAVVDYIAELERGKAAS